MHKFKVGDRVRRLPGTWHGGMQPGHEDTVCGYTDSGLHLAFYGVGHSEESFELVSPVHEPLVPPHALRIPSPLPVDSAERKQYPLYRGLMAYFPAALAAVAHHSYKGNEKHNPGLPMQHARGKSTDHEDCILRHLMEGDYEGVAWRALALLQEKLEAEGAPVAPGATFPDVAK